MFKNFIKSKILNKAHTRQQSITKPNCAFIFSEKYKNREYKNTRKNKNHKNHRPPPFSIKAMDCSIRLVFHKVVAKKKGCTINSHEKKGTSNAIAFFFKKPL